MSAPDRTSRRLPPGVALVEHAGLVGLASRYGAFCPHCYRARTMCPQGPASDCLCEGCGRVFICYRIVGETSDIFSCWPGEEGAPSLANPKVT